MYTFAGLFDYETCCENNPHEKDHYTRIWRSQLLTKSDWTQLPDNGLSEEKREEWSEYRQALRDIPQQPNFPENIVWPTEPSKD